jgi:hypothetical protein
MLLMEPVEWEITLPGQFVFFFTLKSNNEDFYSLKLGVYMVISILSGLEFVV